MTSLIAALLCLPAAAQQTAVAPIPPAVASFEAALVGRWSGILEYRDYRTDARTKLPTWASISLSHSGLAWQYKYDDGPNKEVTENLAVTMTPSTYSTVNIDKPQEPATTATVTGLETLKNGRGTITMLAKATENNHPVDTRTTLTIRRNLLEITKETRAAGEEFRFRDGYTLTRLTPLYEAPTPATH